MSFLNGFHKQKEMSNVTVNKVGMDIVDVEVRQKGKASTDMFFQDPILDYTRDYVVGVSELSVPLNSEPMFSKNEVNDIILKVCNRNTAYGYRDPQIQMGVNGDFSLRSAAVNSAGGFYRALSNFSIQWRGVFGAPVGAPVRYFEIRAMAGGRLVIEGNPEFWLHHFVLLSAYGQELLGFDTPYLHYTMDFIGGGNLTTAPTELTYDGLSGRGIPQGLFVDQDVPALRALNQNLVHIASRECISRLEHRMRIEIDADLSVPANILLDNGIQKVHYNIGSFAFPTGVDQELEVDGGFNMALKIKSPLLTGKYIVKAKETPTTDWYRLLATANVQNMRLHVFIVRREWNEESRSWSLVRNELTMRDQDSWDATLKFVQTF